MLCKPTAACPALLWAFIFICILLLSLPVYAETEAGFSFSVEGSSAVVNGYEGDDVYLEVPDVLGGYDVCAIGEEAFANLSAECVSLPRSLRAIRRGAFRRAQIREIRFSQGLLEIGEEAFLSCENLTGAALPETLVTLSRAAFSGCHSLLYVTLPESLRIVEDPFPDCPRLATLAMVQNHPALMLIGNKLVSREDSRVISVLSSAFSE